jgi:ribosomal protein S18 acetylase RimI-like enzyme
MAGEVHIEEARAITASLVGAVARLAAQLSPSGPAPTVADLEDIVGSPATRLLLAREETGAVVGMLTLALYRIPTSSCAWIEDVVVDEDSRGRGIGEQLTRHALALAKDAGADRVDLTSRPAREAGNRLYQRIGFEVRETNMYRYRLR